MEYTALVEAPEQVPLACIPRTHKKDENGNTIPNSGKPYIMHFGKKGYYVPLSAVKQNARKAHAFESGSDVGQLIATKSPEKWMEYCNPDTLILIQASDGTTCVYTTISVKDTDEQRFVRIISPTVADRCFPKWAERCGIVVDKDGNWDRSNEIFDDGATEREKQRVASRRNVLKWRQKNPVVDANGERIEINLSDPNCFIPGCPTRAQLCPELSHWPVVPEEDAISSIKITPEARKRPKGSSKNRSVVEDEESKTSKFLKANHFIPVGPKGSYAIVERDGFVHIAHYHAGRDDEEEAE